MFSNKIKAENYRLNLCINQQSDTISRQSATINILENKLIKLQAQYDEVLLIGAQHELTINTQKDEINKLNRDKKAYEIAIYEINELSSIATRLAPNRDAVRAFNNVKITIDVTSSDVLITHRKNLEPGYIARIINNQSGICGKHEITKYQLNPEQINNIKELGIYDLDIRLDDDQMVTVKAWIIPDGNSF